MAAESPVLARATAKGLPLPDAYVEWALQTNFRDVGGLKPDGWLSVMLELKQPSCTARDFARWVRRTPALADSIRVSEFYASPPRDLAASRFCTASISKSFLLAMLGRAHPKRREAKDAIEKIYRFEIGFATTRRAKAKPPAPAKPIAGRAKVVIGVIDDGLAFANRRFCREAADVTTRMACLWNQDDPKSAKSAWGYGREYDGDELNGYIKGSTQGTRVDEDQVYALARYRGMNRRATHGTCAMDLACGLDPADVTDETPALIGVQLPGHAIEDTSSGSLGVHILDALHYVLRRAGELCGDDCRVIVNLSYGSIAGPHDGSSIFESAVNELITLRTTERFRLVMPAGNSHLARCHWWCELQPKEATQTGVTRLPWRVLPDDGTPSFLEIWFDNQDARVVVGVESPHGERTDGLLLGTESQCLRGPNGPQCVVTHRNDVSNGAGVMVLVVIAPTATTDPGCATAAAGTWTICVKNLGDTPTIMNAWIQRDDVAYGRKGKGRQSYLLEERYQRFDAQGRRQLEDDPNTFTRRVGTVNGMATSGLTDIVGGILARDAKPARPAFYSGPGLPPIHRKRAAAEKMRMAISEDSPVCHGVLAAGTRSGSMIALSGTSMAAPQYVRELAGLPPTYPAAKPAGKTLAAALGTIVDFAGEPRPVVAPDGDLQVRSQRRRRP